MTAEDILDDEATALGRTGRRLLIGCTVVLAALAAAVALVAGLSWFGGGTGRAGLVVERPQVVGAWQDGAGGTVTLAEDGTFAATGLCGPDGARSGSGTWRFLPDVAGASSVGLEFADGAFTTSFAATGSADEPALWQQVGDPDDGGVCELRQAR